MKRQRGGQQGNQNARKHGIYSFSLGPAEMDMFRQMMAQGNVEPQVAFLYVKLLNTLRHDLDNRRAIDEISRLFTNWYANKFHLYGDSYHTFRKFIDSYIDNFVQMRRQFNLQVSENEKKLPETNRGCFFADFDRLTHEK
jgi:hypothetical protein